MYNLKKLTERSTNITTGSFDILAGAISNNFDVVRGALAEDWRCIWNVDEKGRTAVFLAAERGFVEMVDFLSDQQGVDLEAVDDLGRDIFEAAFEAANPNLDALLMRKIYPGFYSGNDRSP